MTEPRDPLADALQSLDDPLALAARWHAEGEAVALATVTETWGSSPRPPGSRMAISAGGRIAGSVSGGCVESAVVQAAMETLSDRTPQLLSFGVSDSSAWAVGLACGGTIRVFVEPLAAASGYEPLAAAPGYEPLAAASGLMGG